MVYDNENSNDFEDAPPADGFPRPDSWPAVPEGELAEPSPRTVSDCSSPESRGGDPAPSELDTCGLSIQEQAFAYQYMVGYDYIRAAKEAGMPQAQGKRLTTSSHIARFIGQMQKQDAVHDLITRDFVEKQYIRILPKLLGEERVPLVVNGFAEEHFLFQAAPALTALRDMQKTTDFQKQKDADDSNVTVTVNIANLVPNNGT